MIRATTSRSVRVSFLRGRLRPAVRGMLHAARARGNAVECPCCASTFAAFETHRGRADARCSRCGALERHRLLWLFLTERTNLFTDALRVLHVAPEYALRRHLERCGNLDYISADLASPLAAVRADVTDLPFAAESFDVVMCNHVLEHVADDAAAMRELARVLRPAGWAILLSPIDRDRAVTFEDPSVTAPAERLRVFGQEDHVRIYGRDYPQRLRRAGFAVEASTFADELSPAQLERYGLTRCVTVEDLFVCSHA